MGAPFGAKTGIAENGHYFWKLRNALIFNMKRVFQISSDLGGIMPRGLQAGYNVRGARRGGETRYEVVGDAVQAASAPARSAPAAVRADSLYAGVEAAIAAFYRNRAAVLAIA